MVEPAFIHASATVEEGAVVGAGSRIWRNAHVRAGARIGRECVIGKDAYVGAGVEVGDRCKIGNGASVFEGARLASGVFIGPGAILANDRRPRAVRPDGALKGTRDWRIGTVTVEEGASVGAAAVVVPDCRIGRWAMVGAGAVVSGDVPPHALVVGVPARFAGPVCMCGERLERHGDEWACSTCGRRIALPL